MSKIIIGSDVHGNVEYVSKFDELIKREKPDYIFLLGDLLRERNDIIPSILNKYKDIIYAVKGNNDFYEDQELFLFNSLQEYCKVKVDGICFFLCHGDRIDRFYDLSKGSLVVRGHSHVYNIYGNVINPGSIGYPRVNKEHTCIIYHDKVLDLIDLDGFKVLDRRIIEGNIKNNYGNTSENVIN